MIYTNKIANPADANEWTRAYLDSILVEMRLLDSCVPDTSCTIFGRKFATPVMTAAFSHLDRMHEGGMVTMAQGAAEAHALNWAGMGSAEELEGILGACPETVKIVKPYMDRDLVREKLQHAYKASAIAVGMDIDHSFNRKGQHDVVLGMEMAPVSFEELKSFVAETPLPFVVKGVLSVQDALKCREAGVSGILVSHHHGMIPYGVPPLMILPEIAQAVGADMDIFVDCHIDTGADTFKALALGAKAVCVGRAVLDDFGKSGAEGVRAYIEAMTEGLREMMAKTGAADLASIDPGVLHTLV